MIYASRGLRSPGGSRRERRPGHEPNAGTDQEEVAVEVEGRHGPVGLELCDARPRQGQGQVVRARDPESWRRADEAQAPARRPRGDQRGTRSPMVVDLDAIHVAEVHHGGRGMLRGRELPAERRIAFAGEIYYAPKITAFNDADSYQQYGARAEFSVSPQTQIYAGYRKVKFTLNNSHGDAELMSGPHIGVQLSF